MRKAYFLFTLIIFVTASGVLGQTYSGDGEGTEAVPYEVTTADQLNEVRDFPDAYFVQMNDISLDAYSNWEPIGNEINRFYGHYDGAGYTISDLKVDKEDYVGLFGHFGAIDQTYEDQTSIKNVVLENVKVTGTNYVGSLVGKVTGGPNTIIENCYVINGEISGNSFVGGLVGANNSGSGQTGTNLNPIIQTSFANVSVEFIDISEGDNSKIGGLVGCNKSGVVRNSYSASSITINTTSNVQAIGGLVGCMVNSGKIEYSYAYGYLDITATVTDIGGLLGNKEGTSTSVVNSYWDVETTGQSSSAGGIGKTTAQLQKISTFIDWNFTTIWDILEDESYPFLRDIDVVSGFDVTGPSTIQAGAEFDLEITNASDVNGVILNGYYQVAVTTNIAGEPNSGIVFDNAVQFISGETTLANLILTITDDHELSISVQSISDAEIHPIEVTPALAVGLFITQQPAAVISGSNNNLPANLDSIQIITLDQFGNPSAVGLNDVQNVTVAIENDGSPGNDATLGTETVNIQSGTASFTNLTLDKEGTGYTLKFTSNSPETLGEVITDPFDVVDINDLSVFTVTADSPQYSGIEFDVTLTGAADNEGNLLNGDVNVTIDSDITAETFSFNGLVAFTEGEAIVPVILNSSAPTGLEHTLTVSVAGIANDKTTVVTVFPDQSGFTIVHPGQQYQGFDFDLELTGATWVDGSVVSGDVAVTITSNLDGELYNGPLTFTTGETTTPISLTTLGDHTITVSVDGITNDEDIVVNVAENVSGFVVAEVTATQTAGVAFNLVITDARNTGNGLLGGSFAVTVTSNISGEPNEGVVFDGPVTFASGAATFGITLTKAANPNQITIAIETILPTETLDIGVVAAVASQLAVTQQPTGGSGTNNNQPVNVGTVILETQDAFGNPSTVGLSVTENVTASIGFDASEFDDANLGGTTTKNVSSGTATFNDLTLNREGEGYTLVFTADNTGLESIETDEFDISNINDLRSFDIVNPGPQVVGVNFEVTITNAKNSDGSLRNGQFRLQIFDQSGPGNLFDSNVNFIEGEVTITTTDSYIFTGETPTLFRVASHPGSQKTINILVVDEDDSGFQITNPGLQTAGVPFNLILTNATDKAGNSLSGRNHFVTVTTTNLDEGTNGLLFSDSLAFTSGGTTIPDIYLEKAGEQTLSVTIDWITDTEQQLVVVNPNIATQLIVSTQPTGNVGDFEDIPVAISTEPVVVTFYDNFDNPSTVGLDDNLTLTVDLGTDASIGEQANLSGTLTQPLATETASFVFGNLTLDKDGIGYKLAFVFNGTPVFDPVISDSFNMTNINTYGITLDAADPLVFADEQVGYSPVAAEVITITRVGQGDIVGLTVSLDEVVENSFEITQPDPDDLINTPNSTTFTVKPADGLAVGLYEATVTVTANAGLDTEQVEQFDVSFRVLAEFAIEVDADDPLVFPTVSQTYNNNELEQTVTITNTGAGEITGLTADLQSDPSESDFTITSPSPTSLTTDNTSTFTIKPKAGLDPGTYTDIVAVNSDTGQAAEITFAIQFTVVNEFVWEGDESDRWNTAGNWSENQVPGENDFIRIPSVRAQDPFIFDLNVTVQDLIIEEGALLRVRSTRDLTIKEGGRLTIRPGGKLTADGDIFNQAGVDGLLLQSNSTATASLIINNSGVEATVERYLTGSNFNQQQIISTPVDGLSFGSFFSDNQSVLGYYEPTGIYAMREYDEGSGWSPYFNENKQGSLEVGKAYIVGPDGPGALTFKGTLRAVGITKPVAYTSFGWNGIGNPYTSSFDIEDFLTLNVNEFYESNAAIYIYDPQNAPGYQIINSTTINIGEPTEVAQSQGFIVRSKEGDGNMSIENNMRLHGSSPFYKSDADNGLWHHMVLQVMDNYNSSMLTLLAFNKSMTLDLDISYDAGLFNPSQDFMLFTRMPLQKNELNLGVQALPDYGLENIYVPVGFKYPQGGEVTFSLHKFSLPVHLSALFYDSEMDVMVDLSEEDYTTNINAESEPVGRFFFLMKNIPFYAVLFNTANEGGIITASVEGEAIESGEEIIEGSQVSFFAIPDENFEVDEWFVNGVLQEDINTGELIVDDLQNEIDIKVSFKETSTQIEEVITDDNLIIYIFENRIVISGEVDENTRAVLYDMLGRRMRVEDLQPGAYNEIIIEGLKPGGYFIHILNNESQTTRKLLIH